MGEYQRPDRGPAGAAKAAPTPVDAVSEIAAWLGLWMRRNRQTRVPEPLPYAATEAARFWLQVMYPQPPADPALWEQDPDAPKAVGVWISEARVALNGFLRLTQAQRMTVVRMVQEEGIAYRGEAIEHYMAIVNETERMREEPAAYLAGIKERIKRFRVRAFGSAGILPATGSPGVPPGVCKDGVGYV